MCFGSVFRAASRSHTLGRALKRIPKEFTPMRTMDGGWMPKEPIEKLKSFSFQEASLSFSLSLSKRAMHELLLNSTTVSAFVNLDPVTTRMPFSSILSLLRVMKNADTHPFSCWEIFHELKDDHVESSSVRRMHLHFCPRLFVRKKSPGISEDARRCSGFLRNARPSYRVPARVAIMG